MASQTPKNKKGNARAAARKARRDRGRKPGRPSKFTPERVEKLLQALALGAYQETAATYASISVGTLHDWKQLGEAEIEAGANGDRPILNAEELKADPSADPVLGPVTTFAQFFQALKDAESAAEVRNLGIIQEAAQHTWQAAAWWLERKFPGRFALRGRVEVSGPPAANGAPGPIPVEHSGEVKVSGVVILPAPSEEG